MLFIFFSVMWSWLSLSKCKIFFSVLQNSSQSSELGSREVLVHLHLSSCKSAQEKVAEFLRFILWTALSHSICAPHLFLCWKHFSQVPVRFHASYACITHRAGRKPHDNFKGVPKLHGPCSDPASPVSRLKGSQLSPVDCTCCTPLVWLTCSHSAFAFDGMRLLRASVEIGTQLCLLLYIY